MRRKKSLLEKILIAIGIELLVFIVFVGGYLLCTILINREEKVIDLTKTFSERCKDSEYSDGWFCNLTPEGTNSERIYLQQLCLSEGGEEYENQEYLYCLIPYPDAGKQCKNSNDCLGSCDFKEKIPDSCVGSFSLSSEGINCNYPGGLTGVCSEENSLSESLNDCSMEFQMIRNNSPVIKDNVIFKKNRLFEVCSGSGSTEEEE